MLEAPAPTTPATEPPDEDVFAGPVGVAPSRFHLDRIPAEVQDHAFVRIASLAASAWAQRTAPFAVVPDAGRIQRESHAAIAAVVDVLLGGEVGDNAEQIATDLIGAEREPDADMVAAVVRAYVADADTDRPPLRVVEVDGDAVVCPHCGARDKVFQDARAVQHNEVYLEGGRLTIAFGDAEEFVADPAFVCDQCEQPVALPYSPEYDQAAL